MNLSQLFRLALLIGSFFQCLRAQDDIQKLITFLNPVLNTYVQTEALSNQTDHNFNIQANRHPENKQLTDVTITYGHQAPNNQPFEQKFFMLFENKVIPTTFIEFKPNQKAHPSTAPQTAPQSTAPNSPSSNAPQPSPPLPSEPDKKPHRLSNDQMSKALDTMHYKSVAFADGQLARQRQEENKNYLNAQADYLTQKIQAQTFSSPEAARQQVQAMRYDQREALHKEFATQEIALLIQAHHDAARQAAAQAERDKSESRFNGFAQCCKAKGFSEKAALSAAKLNEIYLSYKSDLGKDYSFDEFFQSLEINELCAGLTHPPETLLRAISKPDFQYAFRDIAQANPEKIYSQLRFYTYPNCREALLHLDHNLDALTANFDKLQSAQAQDQMFGNDTQARNDFNTWLTTAVKPQIAQAHEVAVKEIKKTLDAAAKPDSKVSLNPQAKKCFAPYANNLENDQTIIQTVNATYDLYNRYECLAREPGNNGTLAKSLASSLRTSMVCHDNSITSRALKLKNQGETYAASNILKVGDILLSLFEGYLMRPSKKLIQSTYKGFAHRVQEFPEIGRSACATLAQVFSRCITEGATAARIASLMALTSFGPSDNPLLYEERCKEIEHYQDTFRRRGNRIVDGIASFIQTKKIEQLKFDQQAEALGASMAYGAINSFSQEKRSLEELLSEKQLDDATALGQRIIDNYNAFTVEALGEFCGSTLAVGIVCHAILKTGGALVNAMRSMQKVTMLEIAQESLALQRSTAQVIGGSQAAPSIAMQRRALETTLDASSTFETATKKSIENFCGKNYLESGKEYATSIAEMIQLTKEEVALVAEGPHLHEGPLGLRSNLLFQEASTITSGAEASTAQLSQAHETCSSILAEYGLELNDLSSKTLQSIDKIITSPTLDPATRQKCIKNTLKELIEQKCPKLKDISWAKNIPLTSCEQTNEAILIARNTKLVESTSATKRIVSMAERKRTENALRRALARGHNPPGLKDGADSIVGRINRSNGQWGNIQGATAELEAGLKLEADGQKIIEYGMKALNPADSVLYDLDIVTEKFAYEVKDVNWTKWSIQKISDEIKKWECRKASACALKKHFAIYSRNSLPQKLSEWCLENKIPIITGW